jgi:hypothetical protein
MGAGPVRPKDRISRNLEKSSRLHASRLRLPERTLAGVIDHGRNRAGHHPGHAGPTVSLSLSSAAVPPSAMQPRKAAADSPEWFRIPTGYWRELPMPGLWRMSHAASG